MGRLTGDHGGSLVVHKLFRQQEGQDLKQSLPLRNHSKPYIKRANIGLPNVYWESSGWPTYPGTAAPGSSVTLTLPSSFTLCRLVRDHGLFIPPSLLHLYIQQRGTGWLSCLCVHSSTHFWAHPSDRAESHSALPQTQVAVSHERG